MKKLLGLTLPMFFVLTVFGHDPIIPWPLDSYREHLCNQDVEGSWIAFNQNNAVWFVQIVKPNRESRPSLIISLTPFFTPVLASTGFYSPQIGWLLPVDGAFAGRVTTIKRHENHVVIFKNLDGLYLRIETEKEQYQDLILYRNHSSLYD